jgi:hypothetical protein
MNWLHYLAEANLYLAVFYLAYCLLLSRETHYQLNRIYLLFSCVAAFALPVLQVGVLKPNMQMVEPPVYAMLSDRVAEAPLQMQIQTVHDANPIEHKVQQITRQPEVKPVQAAIPASKPQLGVADYLWYAYLTGSTISLAVLLVRLISLLLLTRRAVRTKHGRHTIIQLPGTNVAFSFFNYLFLGDNALATDTIITHELVHIRQKHSADIIFLELLKIINWFNPCIYLLQNSLKTIHEYIADQHTVSHQTDTHTYATFLVNTAHGVGGSPITHSFFNYNLLKKRIIMLNQKPSGKSARLKYLIAAPICAGLLCVSTLAFSKDYGFIDLDPAKIGSAVHEIKSAPIISHIIEKVTRPSSPNKNIKTVKIKSVSVADDPAGKVTPSGYKEGYEKLTWAFIEDMRFSRGLSYYQSFATTQPHSLNDAVVVIGFTVTADQKISNINVIKSSGTVMDDAIAGAFGNYTGTVTDKPGKHSYLVHISTHGHTETEDDATCKKYGYENHITVAIADHITTTDAPKPIPVDTAYQNNLQKFYKDLKWYIQYPYTERENNIQGRAIVRFCVDDNGELQYLAIYRAPSIKLGYQVFWAMKHSAFLKPLKGNWALSVAFDMGGLEPETRPITEIKQDTTTRHLHSDPNGTGFKWTLGGANPAFTYDPHNMHGPYKTPVKVLSELVIKAER